MTLFLLPAIIAELLYGSTPITNLTPLVPEILVYGSAALLIRELVRRRGTGWLGIVLLGIAFAVAQESSSCRPRYCLASSAWTRSTFMAGRSG